MPLAAAADFSSVERAEDPGFLAGVDPDLLVGAGARVGAGLRLVGTTFGRGVRLVGFGGAIFFDAIENRLLSNSTTSVWVPFVTLTLKSWIFAAGSMLE